MSSVTSLHDGFLSTLPGELDFSSHFQFLLCHTDMDPLPQSVAGAVPTFSDGVVAAIATDGSSMLITSPNAQYIPQVDYSLLTVHLRDDARFGLADPVNAPQIFLWKYPYLCAILKPAPDHDSLGALWKTPPKAISSSTKGQ